MKMSVEHWWNDKDRAKKKSTQRKACLSKTLYTTNITWSDLELSPCLRRDNPVANHLSHVTTISSLVKGKVHPCTGTEALHRPYGRQGE
jgi:hypothetical protein